jgi:molecular chaperone GrpE
VTDEPDVTPDETVDASGAPADADGRPQAAAGEPVVRDRRRVKDGRAGPREAQPADGPRAGEKPSGADPAAPVGASVAETVEAEPVEGEVVDTAPEPAGAAEAEPEVAVPGDEAPGGFAAELESLRAALDERTRDVQRVSAEYANYRKRVDRDRELIGQQATANVISTLLPVLDDLDRAREHGELADGVAAIVDQLVATTAKFGLSPFGEKGDPFDPNRHEAVAHRTSTEVTQPTCIDVLRRGYLLGDRLLRPAMVAVAEPE